MSSNSTRLKFLLTAMLGGILGGAAVWIGQSQSIQLAPKGMSYADLAAVLLTCVSVIVTAIGLFVGAMAIWGYGHFKELAIESAKTQANESAKSQLAAELKDGDLKKHIEKIVSEFLDSSFKSGEFKKMLKDHFDRAAFAETAEKWSEVDEAGEE